MNSIIEIALITYNRPTMVSKWMEVFGKKIAAKEGYSLSIYDSSTNLETEDVIGSYSYLNIDYHRIDSNIRIDEKVMMAIVNSNAKYIWPIGDSRYVDDDFLDIKLKRVISDNYEIINILDQGSPENDYRDMSCPGECLAEYWAYISLLGGGIFQTSIVGCLQNRDLYRGYLNKYNRIDGFSYLGIIFDIIDNKNSKIINLCTNIYKLSVQKKQAWFSRYLIVWCDNLVYMVDSLPDSYNQYKDNILKNSWKIQKWDSFTCLSYIKINGKLTFSDYFDSRKNLKRVSDHRLRILLFCLAPKWLVTFMRSNYVFVRDAISTIYKSE